MKTKRFTFVSRSVLLAVLAAGLGASHASGQFVILPNGNRIDGTDIRSRPNGEVILTTPQGQRTFARGQYARAESARPAAMDRAAQLTQQGNHDEAIRLLEQVVNEHRFLTWDNNARVALARVHTAKGDHARAVTTYEELFRAAPEFLNESAAVWGFRNALLEAKQFDRLGTELDQAVAGGSRTDAARAHVMRGDVKLAQGNVEGAVMDYLRSALLFEREAAVQPEALFKAGLGLERLRDPRAREMFQRVVQNHPNSPFAQQARAKL
ncbi:MAG TPA: tetratricopeptide repeat protein [Kiritimatiellia bacterium]|nr:tetratricopeptide repeat protein [Kiritimatiellia bacterium]